MNTPKNTKELTQPIEHLVERYVPDGRRAVRDAGVRGGDAVARRTDQGELFEAYLEEAMRGLPGVRVKSQVKRRFWQPPGEAARVLKPDLVVQVAGTDRPLVVDAKWKVPEHGRPGDDDLRQVFAYLHGFEADRGVLVYPRASDRQRSHEAPFLGGASRGRVAFLDLFPSGKPDVHALRVSLPAVLGLVEPCTAAGA